MADVDFDSAPDESQQSSAPAPQQFDNSQSVDFDSAPDESAQRSSSPLGAFVRHGIRELVPNLVGAAAGDVAGVAAGAAGTVATGNPVVGGIAGFGGAVVGSIAGQEAADAVQEKLLSALGADKSEALGGLFNREQAEADVQQHPHLTAAADVLDALGVFNVGGVAKDLGEEVARRVVAAGAVGGINAEEQYRRTGDIDPTDVGIAAAGGALMSGGRKWIQPAERVAERVGGSVPRLTGRSQSQDGAVTGRPGVEQDFDAAQDQSEGNVHNPVANNALGAGQIHSGPQPPAAGHTSEDYGNTIGGEGSTKQYGKGKPIQQEGVHADVESTSMVVGDLLDPAIEAAVKKPDKSTATGTLAAELDESGQQSVKPGTPMERTTFDPNRNPTKETIQPNATQSFDPENNPVKAAPQPNASRREPTQEAVREYPDLPGDFGNEKPTLSEKGTTAEGRAFPEILSPETQGTGKSAQAPQAQVPPHVQKAIDALRARGDHGRADLLENMEPATRTAAAIKINKQLVGSNNPENRPKVNGVTVRSGVDAARKQGALDALQQAHDKFPPAENEENGATLDRARQMVDAAQSAYGSEKHPLDAYKPRVKSGAYQLVQAARRLLAKPTPTKIDEFRTLEMSLRGGGAREEQALAREKADIELDKRGAAVKEAGPAIEGVAEPPQARVTFPDVPNEVLNKGRAIDEDRQALHEYINGLSDPDYARLNEAFKTDEHPLEQVVKLAKDPHKLQLQMEAQMDRGPGHLDLVNAHDESLPPSKKVVAKAPKEEVTAPVTKRDDLVAAYQDKYGGKMTPEELAAYKAAKERKAKGETAPSKEELALLKGDKLSEEERAQNRATDDRHLDTEAMNGTWGPVLRKAAEMLKDESGAVNLHKIAPWLFGGTANPRNPAAADGVRTMVHQAHDWFTNFVNAGKNRDMMLKRMLAEIPPEMRGAVAKEFGRKMQARENPVTPIEKRMYPVWKKLMGELHDLYDEVDMLDPANKLHPNTGVLQRGDKSILPERFGGHDVDFTPRSRQASTLPEKMRPDPGNVFKRTLSTWRPAVEQRDFVALKGNGQRLVAKLDKDGDLTVFRNGSPQKISTNIDTLNPGEKLTLTIRGKKIDFDVDHASDKEIEANVKDIKFENPVFSLLKAVHETGAVRDTLELLQKLRDDPDFRKFSVVKKNMDTEIPKGWRKTRLEAMQQTRGLAPKDIYYHPRIANKLDDMAHMGFGVDDLSALSNIARGISNSLYFFGPLIHAGNVLQNYATARGFAWANPLAYGPMIHDGAQSIQSVFRQDKFNDDLRKVGGNPMMMSTIMPDGFKATAAQHLGVDLAKNPDKWTPLSKALGMDIPSLGRAVLAVANTPMWFVNDVAFQMLTRERLRQGLARDHNYTLREAVDEAHKFVHDYQEKEGTVMGSRGVQQFMMDPAFTWFGRYHVALARSIGHMINDLAIGAPHERTRAIGQLVVGSLIAFALWPQIEKGLQWLTGNEDLRLGQRGLGVYADAAKKLYEEGPAAYPKAVAKVWTPSPAASVGWDLLSGNNSFMQKGIVEPGSGWGAGAAKVGDYALGKLVPPYEQVSRFATDKNTEGPGDVARRFGEGLVGITEKSARAQKWENTAGRRAAQQARKDQKKPSGLLGALYNKATGP